MVNSIEEEKNNSPILIQEIVFDYYKVCLKGWRKQDLRVWDAFILHQGWNNKLQCGVDELGDW